MAVKKLSKLEETFALHLKAEGLPPPVRELKFHPKRKWAFDFAWPAFKIAVECEGLTWGKGKSRHTTDSGYEKDQEKYNNATLLGWKVLKFTNSQINKGMAIDMTKKLILKEAQC